MTEYGFANQEIQELKLKLEIQRKALAKYNTFLQNTKQLESLLQESKRVLQDDYIVETVDFTNPECILLLNQIEVEDLKEFDDFTKLLQKTDGNAIDNLEEAKKIALEGNAKMEVDETVSIEEYDSAESISEAEPTFEFGSSFDF
ncbi:hypothetical protein HDV01_006710 [Terramyces sp. JEL0728]|nr:hypothetical protein HDV01_006710 [Terramyces sp. JEL0728]